MPISAFGLARALPWAALAATTLAAIALILAPAGGPTDPAEPYAARLARATPLVEPPPVPPAGSVGEGTRRMAARLRQLSEAADPLDNPYDMAPRVEVLEKRIAEAPDPATADQLRSRLALDLLAGGWPSEALEVTDDLDRRGAFDPALLRQFGFSDLLMFRGIAHLRIGEQDNCIAHHGSESCLFPIQGGGIHSNPRGSRAAVASFTEALKANPNNLGARWLLNIAYMTLGEYPGRVPPAQLIPPESLRSERDFPVFPDVAAASNLRIAGLAGGAVLDDLDGDGDLDVMVSHTGLTDQLRVFRNDGDAGFTEDTAEAGVLGEWGGLNLASADYDNDGDVDVLVLRGGWLRALGRLPKSLLQNQGNLTFEDVTEAAGLLTFHPTQAGTWADYDGDGWLDLFVGNESGEGDYNPSELWHSNRDGTFTNRIRDLSDPDLGFVKGAAWGDYDNDGRPDLYVSIRGRSNQLFHNDGPGPAGSWRFRDVAEQAGVLMPKASFPTWFWDYDNDGWLDLVVFGFGAIGIADVAELHLGIPGLAPLPVLYRNNRDGTFADVTMQAGLDRVTLVMGSNFGDLDNDGWLDCYLGTGDPNLLTLMPNRLFRNDRGQRFEDVTSAARMGHLQKGHGVAFGDVDNDGDQDVFEQMGGQLSGDVAYSALYENPGFGNHWITLVLDGRRSNRSGVGTRIRASIDGPGGARDVHVTGGTGGSFGCSSLQQEMGLGDASAIRALEVTWPASGTTQTFTDVPVDRFYRVIEGEAELLPLERPRHQLGKRPPGSGS